MNQSMAMFYTYRYHLQPGDGTAYSFTITPFRRTPISLSIEPGAPALDISPAPLYTLVGGVGSWEEAEENFVTLGICMPASQGSYEVRKSSLRAPQPHLVRYLSSHMPHVDRYTLAAVVLAASILADRPDALEEAAEAMLRAPELL